MNAIDALELEYLEFPGDVETAELIWITWDVDLAVLEALIDRIEAKGR